MPISLRKTTQVQTQKPALFLQKKVTKKPHKKSRKFAVRKSAFKALWLLIFCSKLTQPLANIFQVFDFPEVAVISHSISNVL